MPKICYIPKTFTPIQQQIIDAANGVFLKYEAMGYIGLTLRQVFYQFVAKHLFPAAWNMTMQADGKWAYDANGTNNNGPNYSKLGDILGDARMAGLVDWDHIVDTTRSMVKNSHWKHPADIIKEAIPSYSIDKWIDQPDYVEVWVEKDALVRIIGSVCSRLDVPYFACRGYASISSAWAAGQRLKERADAGKTIHIVHLGDHDPSGVDMSRDVKERLEVFVGAKLHVLRAALNWSQIEHYAPPPQPAKRTDSRAKKYVAKYGIHSWELDALEPPVLADIVTRAVKQFRDEAKWKEQVDKQERGRNVLKAIHKRWKDVVKLLQGTQV